ncbi:MAG: helix-turn-helix domain-containing protein [Armatimonadetes bacterium]|nr:helix-turn-helix domain-containing protein [Armatimonadota bacterium]
MGQEELIRERRYAEVNVSRAVEAVLRRPDEVGGVERLAHESGYTRSHWSRIFSHLIGETPAAFVRRIRVEKAQHLLLHTDLEVAQVGSACGYTDHSAFTRTFHLVTGMTPTAFRKSGPRQLDRDSMKIHWVSAWTESEADESVVLAKRFPIEYRRREPVRLAAKEQFGSYALAGQRLGLVVEEVGRQGLDIHRRYFTVYWDSTFTHPTSEGMRSHVGFELRPGEALPNGFSPMTIPGGRYATVSRPVRRTERNEAWAWVVRRLSHGFAFDEHDGPPIPWEQALTTIWKEIE